MVGSKVVDYRGRIVPSTSFEMGCVDNGFSKSGMARLAQSIKEK